MTLRTLAVAGLLLGAVGCTGPRGGSYAQATDSATAACQRNPAWCASVAGEEAVVPLRIRAAQVAAAGKAWQELEALVEAQLDRLMEECARQADVEVNRKELSGRHPTKAECDEQVGGTRENPITRAMRLGQAKHVLALHCAEEKLGRAFPGRFSLQQRYRLNPESGHPERVSHEMELAMLRQGAGSQLVGTIVPDTVIHTGNPLQAQRVYDFKFPCPEANDPSWRRYPPNHALKVKTQGAAYEKGPWRASSPCNPQRDIPLSARYPQIRLHSIGNHLFVRDGLTLRFLMHRFHQAFAPGVVHALDAFMRVIRPETLSVYRDMEGDWRDLDDMAWQRIRKELLESESPYVTLANRPDGVPEFQFEYVGISQEEHQSLEDPELTCMATFWLSTEFMEHNGPGRIRELAVEVASLLPFNSGYTSLSFNAFHQFPGVTRRVRERCFRYPGMDVLQDDLYRCIGTRVPGAYWLTFLGQPVLGELGGVDGLRSRLTSPGTTVQQVGDERAVVTLGQWPEAGDLDAGQDLPAYRELARVLEPWLYHDSGRVFDSDFPPKDKLRWERRFLD